MGNPQTAFVDLLLAAMKSAALEGELTQLQTQLDPTETGKGKMKVVRIIVIPEEMRCNFPSHAPLGTGQG